MIAVGSTKDKECTRSSVRNKACLACVHQGESEEEESGSCFKKCLDYDALGQSHRRTHGTHRSQVYLLTGCRATRKEQREYTWRLFVTGHWSIQHSCHSSVIHSFL